MYTALSHLLSQCLGEIHYMTTLFSVRADDPVVIWITVEVAAHPAHVAPELSIQNNSQREHAVPEKI